MKIRPVGTELSYADARIKSHDEANNRFSQFCECAYKLCVCANVVVTPFINNIQHFIFQVMHTTLKNVELLKHFKIRKLLQHVSV